MAEAINHFSHEEHPLLLSQVDKKIICYGCQEQVLESKAYCCFSCDFFLHKRCAELPLEITHPMHSQHPLLLLKEPPYFGGRVWCNACGRDDWKFFSYHCKSCEFDLDVSCANIVDRRLEHESHEHPMILQQKPATFHCSACNQKEEDSSYMCITCPYWIHKRCASLPRSMKHKNHNHSLFLAYSLPVDYRNFKQYCPVCHFKVHPTSWVYYCGPCKYFVHLTCIVISWEDTEQQPWEDISNSISFEGGVMPPDSSSRQVDAVNNSINGVRDLQIEIVGSPPAPELVQNIVSIKHQRPNAELDVANRARDGVTVEQSGNEATEEHHSLDATRLQEHGSITVKATYREDIIKFQLSFSARKMDLEVKVARRLNLTVGSFRIKYLDEEGDWVLVTCDEDLNTTLSTLRSLDRTQIKVLVNPFY